MADTKLPDDPPSPIASPPDPHTQPAKPALKQHDDEKEHVKPRGILKWDEARIQEHDKLRGTRMKIEEPDTPYHYDSGSETEGSHHSASPKQDKNTLPWEQLENKLHGVAAAEEALPSDQNHEMTEEEREREMKAIQFKEHRKRHYNEMELVRRFRQEHAVDAMEDDGDDE